MLAVSCPADTLRVVTWNLEPVTADGASSRQQIRPADAAAVLKPLAADVILLQQVPDWQTCAELARAMEPGNYSVLVCSAFRDARTATLSQEQVAILAKHRAYVSWSHPWTAQGEPAIPGGFAFAAIRVRGQRFGFFSVRPGGASTPLRQLVAQVDSVRSWVTNQVQLLVVGGTLHAEGMDQRASPPGTLRLLEEAGFANVFRQIPAIARIASPQETGELAAAGDYLLTQPPGCATHPRVLSNNIAGHFPVACDLEIDPAWIAAAWASQAEVSSAAGTLPLGGTNSSLGSQAGAAQGLAQPHAFTPQLIIALLCGLIVGLTGLVWVLASRRRRRWPKGPRLLPFDAENGPLAPSAYTVVVGTASGSGAALPGDPARSAPQPIIQIESPEATHTQAELLRQRALAAEERAEQATAALRTGLIHQMSRWLKQKLVRKLVVDRAQLLEGQRAATEKARTVEARLARVELQIQQQNAGYQQRIEDLTRELIAAKEENRELIRTQIRQVKAEMEIARSRLLAQAAGADRR